MQWIINLVARLLGIRPLSREEEETLWVRATVDEAYRRLKLADDQFEICRSRWLADKSDANMTAVEYAVETVMDAKRGVRAAEAIYCDHQLKLWRGEYRTTA